MVEIVMTFSSYRKDKNLNPVGDPHYVTVRGTSAESINAQVQTLRDNLDMTKWTPLNFVRVYSMGVI